MKPMNHTLYTVPVTTRLTSIRWFAIPFHYTAEVNVLSSRESNPTGVNTCCCLYPRHALPFVVPSRLRSIAAAAHAAPLARVIAAGIVE